MAAMEVKFKLKCVGCGYVEERPANDCREQPFCDKCYMPMTLESVESKSVQRRKAAQTKGDR